MAFPELARIVTDNLHYVKIVILLNDKSNLTNNVVIHLSEITSDMEKARNVIDAARTSVGQDVSPIDMINIESLAKRIIELMKYKQRLHNYLEEKMRMIAPNLSALVGEVMGAKLISHAGSLVNLAKYPASTIQILGAEKALFRALKNKGNTPKYGLIFNCAFIGKAERKNRGRISRYLANKCSIASRIDAFVEGFTTNAFGKKLREQVENRLRFFSEGLMPKKNVMAMQETLTSLMSTQVRENYLLK